MLQYVAVLFEGLKEGGGRTRKSGTNNLSKFVAM